MEIFIFGAGATKAAQDKQSPSLHQQASLANDLFDSKYGPWADELGISRETLARWQAEWQIAHPNNLEDWLSDRWEKAQTSINQQVKDKVLQELAKIAFFIRNLMQGVSLTYQSNSCYGRLLHHLTENDNLEFGLISFNYDTMLDKAVQEHGASLHNLAQYFKHRLIKPHGSVNWLFEPDNSTMPTLERANSIVDRIAHLPVAFSAFFMPVPLKNLQVMNPNDKELNHLDLMYDERFGWQYFLPSVVLPMTGKVYGIQCDGLHQQLKSNLEQLLARASQVYIVGYTCRDSIIQEVLRNSLSPTVPIVLVGCHHQTCNQLGQYLSTIVELPNPIALYDKGFTNFVDEYITGSFAPTSSPATPILSITSE